MTLQVNLINLGSYPNDGAGDDLRTAFLKANSNFQSISNNVVLTAENMGAGAPIFVGKVDNSLRFRSIETSNANMSISYDSDKISLTVKNSIAALQEDTSPNLGGRLNLNQHDIEGFGNIDIIGNITANDITGNFIGNFTGDISGNIYGNLFGNVEGNVTGNLFGNVEGNVTGNLLGNVEGNVTGNVTGQVSDISNHLISGLADVSNQIPNSGQALLWNGTSWAPGDVAFPTTNIVTRIIPGNNITISPPNGRGDVTINATGGGGGTSITDYDFGILSGVRNPFDLVINFTNVDFGSLDNPSNVNLNLGFVDQGAPLYNLSSSENSVQEGQSFIVALTTANVSNGTLIPYTITGVSAEDIDVPLTGNFTINEGSANITVNVLSDLLSETETFILTLDNITPSVFVSVLINDPGQGNEYTGGDADGGGPGTTTFSVVADGGTPSTAIFSVVADGGVVVPIIDGGNSETVTFTQVLEGGSPSSVSTENYDGGLIA